MTLLRGWRTQLRPLSGCIRVLMLAGCDDVGLAAGEALRHVRGLNSDLLPLVS